MTTLAARVCTQARSAWPVRRFAAPTGIVTVSFLLGWVLTELGPTVAFLPFALCAALLFVFAALRRPLYAVLVLVALVSAYPIARIEVGSVPLYVTDMLAALALLAVWLCGISHSRFHLALGIYLAAWIPAWIYQVVKTDLVLEPTYGLVRNVLAVAVAIPVAVAIRRRRAVELFILVFAVGTILTAALAVAQSTPGLQGSVRDLLSTLAPSFAPNAYQVYPERAFALFTAPTALSGYLAVALPVFIASMSIANKDRRRILIFAISATVLALIATYSRQWVPALAIGLLVLVIIRPPVPRRTVFTAGATVVLASLALSSGVLNSGYFSERFSRLGTNDQNVEIRLERQREFFAATRAGGPDSLLGRGFAGQDIVARNLTDIKTTDALRQGVNDNSFLLEFFNHGLVAGLLYVGILLGVLGGAIRMARQPGPYSALLAGLSASLVTAMALHFFDRYFSETVFMKMLLWMLIGFTLAVIRLARSDALPRADRIAESAQ